MFIINTNSRKRDTCRICRQKSRSCISLSGKLEGFQNLTVEKGLQVCCGFICENVDEWSICDLCADELKITYIFLNKFRESEKFYNEQIASKQVAQIEKIEFLDGYEPYSNDGWDEVPIEQSLVPEEEETTDGSLNLKDIAFNDEPFIYKGITIKKPSKKPVKDNIYVPSPSEPTRPRRSTVSKKTYIEYEVSTPETDVLELEETNVADTDFVVSDLEDSEEVSEAEEFQPPSDEHRSVRKRSRPKEESRKKEKPAIPFIHKKQDDVDNELEGDFAVEVDGKIMQKCNKCGKMFPKLGSLRSHIKFVHLKVREWLCSMCRKYIFLPLELKSSFPFIAKMFVSKLRLEEHFRSHTGDRPYKCEFCPMAFATPTRKKLHMIIHTGENPNVCNFCGKKFASYATLMGHRFIHTKKGVECTVCKKHFARAVDVKKHMAVHTQEKSFICKICGKGYLYATSLKSHTRNHTFENVTCKSCGDSVSSLEEWNYHQQLHAKEIYECEDCGVTFMEQHE